MRVADIKIFPSFLERGPAPEKLKRKEEYYLRTGRFESEVVLDAAGNLIDGYTTYLLARRYGVEHVTVSYGRRQIIRAAHKPGGKLYIWELPKTLVGQVRAGDRCVVRTEKGRNMVYVAAVEEYRGQGPEPLKMVLWRCKEGGRHSGYQRTDSVHH